MKEHQDPYSVAGRHLLNSALAFAHGCVQLLGGFAVLIQGPLSPALKQSLQHFITGSDLLAAHLSATLTGNEVQSPERYLEGHYEYLRGQRELAEIRDETGSEDDSNRVARLVASIN